MDRSRLAIIIPAFNESATIEGVVRAASAYGFPIVVDDGSRDGTAERARVAGADLVVHQSNRGYDVALDSGFARAAELACTYALTMDADGQHDPSVLNDFIRALQCGADVVAGVRDRRQRFAEHLFAVYTDGRWGIKDPLCGLKAYRMDVYHELGHFDTHRSIGTELLLYAARRKKRIDQVPVKTRDRLDAPRFGNRLKGNLRILKGLIRSIP